MNHFASPQFWECYSRPPLAVRQLADKSYELIKEDPHHPSVRLKKVGRYYAARVGLHYRALAVEAPDGLVWFWIGSHAEYDQIIGEQVVCHRSSPQSSAFAGGATTSLRHCAIA